MKAQGLPINFIVIAALAILILILAAGFVVAGGGSIQSSMGPQVFRTNCESTCSVLQRQASVLNYVNGDADHLVGSTTTQYCIPQALKGQTNEVSCYGYGVQCFVTFENGITKKLDCDLGTSGNST